ncbi:rhodanese-like domain-containing protein [Methylotenera sp.]|uniref:rhodanese-like domain-containing protein n=1 Tax=Methylotenera sp. TaxID=2051956 RepID=UPI00248A43DA|nr:rhodanese-like domain-containing protein [Methylotenera sp.]MDI1297602.1 rhodanese-like domain-containing protein [Methylotenera sp.]
MSNLDAILQLAQKRAIDSSFPYAGALTPRETFELLQKNPEVMLVDVRTQAELELVGRVPNAMSIEWATYPGMVKNQDFAQQLADNVDIKLTVIFMCRTGGRSHNAAVVAEQLGFDKAYNMLEGFEGEANELKQRTLINGWKHAGLPWTN